MADGRGYSWEDDPGPPTASGWAELLAITPIHRGLGREVVGREAFRWHHGPMLCRGRPDGSAKVWVGSSGDRGLRPIKTPNLQAVVAFGMFAQQAVDLWPGRSGLTVAKVPHPSSRNSTTLLNEWRTKIGQLRGVVTPDPNGDATGPNYGTSFRKEDYARIPPGDLPFGVPAWLGDDAWGRNASPRHNNSVSRPTPDDRHTLTWIAPQT